MKRTPLYEMHKKLGAKMVEFGGWDMPVSYSGILKEHEAVRTKMGLFDVSHMGEIRVDGPDAVSFLQWLTSNDVSLMYDGRCQYSLLTNPQGGVVDDIILHRLNSRSFFICVNASNTDKDFGWLLKNRGTFDVQIVNRSAEFSQIALQGPLSADLMRKVFPALEAAALRIYHFLEGTQDGCEVLVARTGYTGEDGFEIYCHNKDAVSLWSRLLEEGTPLGLVPCGLGCRDTLRLEMAYPLYGHELTDEISPLEAGLGWVVKFNKGDFIGREVLQKQNDGGLSRCRVGFSMVDEGIARADYPIFSGEEKIGWVSSGTYSPSLDKSIGCGYVPKSFSTLGKNFEIEIRGKKKKAVVVATPFYKRKS
ncbi:MAG: glycine cleavage system aminomethyltransferase GcvT [bacterium]